MKDNNIIRLGFVLTWILMFIFYVKLLVSINQIKQKLSQSLETTISIDDPNLAILIADKDATILNLMRRNKILENRYYKLAEDFKETTK